MAKARDDTPVPVGPPRRLFLDDDPVRADAFLSVYPDAIWVATVADCLIALEESWDEVHLDHDLGGERYVDVARPDCGMAVVRWLADRPRPHLRPTRFVVHSHNGVAATLMVLHIKGLGLDAVGQPFDEGKWRPRPVPRWRSVLARLLGRRRPAGRCG